MKTIYKVLFLFLLAPIFSNAQQADDVLGTWINPSGEGKIKVIKVGDAYFGNLVWLKNPLTKMGQPKLDDQNPDPAKRSRKKLGLLLLTNFKFDPNSKEWTDGQIYDPKNGKTYSCKMTMQGKDVLDIRGFMGISLIGRTETWKRVE